MQHPPDRIETNRLILQRWRVTDAPLMKEALDASTDHLNAFTPWVLKESATIPDLEGRIARHSTGFDAGTEYVYGIWQRDERRVLGGCGLYRRIGDGALEVGYWLRPDATGQGYASEASEALTEAAFRLPDIERLEMRVESRNAASARIPPRLGYTHVRTMETGDAISDAPRPLMVFEKRAP